MRPIHLNVRRNKKQNRERRNGTNMFENTSLRSAQINAYSRKLEVNLFSPVIKDSH